ncbi:transcription factor E4F1 [Notothenia coriiceps]|uniref:Transcription factor E4F1 n=1 Tax=Notothenia coriiceps TaxID=8208 RepID=A0A6I9PXJ4_9TELE|nr:PREDICTED: transcription factor E4F1-like [Notothenia coriiceps]
MNVENNHTAETETEQTTDGNETITIQTTLGDEDEDVHKCGRCQTEFSTLEAFIQHKLQQNCKRMEANQEVTAANGSSSSEVKTAKGASSDERVKITNDESSGTFGRGRRKKIVSPKVNDQSDGTEGSLSDNAESDKSVVYKVNQEGRYICQLCDKTFKTTNILRTHMKTHSDQKNFSCDLCGTSFRTKGSLIRHNRRHTDERPYRCTLCGQSFRESGALTRHLKALTPCTEKIRFVQYKEILVSKDGIQKGVDDAVAGQQHEVVVLEHQPEEEEVEEEGMVEAQTAVLSVVEAGSHEVLHQVHFTMEVNGTTQEQQVSRETHLAQLLKQTRTCKKKSLHSFKTAKMRSMGNTIMKVVQRIVSQSQAAGNTGSHQIIVRNVAMNEEGASISDCGDTITIATPESLTEQVAMTLASAISDGTLLATTGTVETPDGTVTMLTTEETVEEEGIHMVQQQEEYVITSPEVEIQTVIV